MLRQSTPSPYLQASDPCSDVLHTLTFAPVEGRLSGCQHWARLDACPHSRPVLSLPCSVHDCTHILTSTQALSHDEASNQKYGEDPFCEPVGTARQLSDMLNGGITLDSPAGWDAWPEDLPLLVYHGGEDAICDPKAAIRFGERVRAKDKKVEIIEVSLLPLF